MDYKLELIAVPVSDVDRAKAFYVDQAGFNPDHDHKVSDELRPVGHISGFTASQKRSLRKMLKPLETGEHGSAEPSRWASERDLEWIALRPELVIEVGYDHAAAGRIRHGTRFLRFRDDKEPDECRFEDLDQGE